ncbi:MAG: serine--tRNA ligase [Pseudomonadota bacterium]
MLDPQLIRNELAEVAKALRKRGLELDIETINELESKRKLIQMQTQELQSLRNSISKEIGKIKGQGGDAQSVMDEVATIKNKLDDSEEALEQIQIKLNEILIGIPNIPHESVSPGKDEQDNIEIRRWGNPKEINFNARDHVDLGESLGMIDFESAVKITSARFVIMHADIARLHRSLIQFMLNTHIEEHGYQEINVPYLVNSDSAMGTGQLPKFSEDLFFVNEQEFYLIPTAEVPVTNLARDEIFNGNSLPRKYVCHSPCFRSEAGSYGKDTRGMIRQHQFEKVELVQMVNPESSYDVLEELTGHAEVILQKLELPYRVVSLCGGDLGFSAAKTYDLEVWLPGQEKYREISSCSNFEAFQARRMKARYRRSDSNKPELIHTLNGSALAVGRTLIAIMENYQDENGNIIVPDVLRPYMRNQAIINAIK